MKTSVSNIPCDLFQWLYLSLGKVNITPHCFWYLYKHKWYLLTWTFQAIRQRYCHNVWQEISTLLKTILKNVSKNKNKSHQMTSTFKSWFWNYKPLERTCTLKVPCQTLIPSRQDMLKLMSFYICNFCRFCICYLFLC